MNILLINHEKGGGGASFSLVELAQELLKMGHNIYVLTPYAEGLLIDKLKQMPVVILPEKYYCWQIGHFNIRIDFKNKIKWYLKLRRINIKTAKKIANYVVKNNIDIIHTNTVATNIGALVSKYSNIPHVWHLREFGDLDHGLYFYDNKYIAYKFMNKYTSKFICVSKAIDEHYDKLSQKKKKVIYNGVSSTNLNSNHYTSSKIINILISGHVFEPKGQHEAVKACALLMKQGIDNFILNIAGSGEPYFEIPKELKNKVKFLGRIDNMPELRKTMDIELICSKCEAFGRTTVEAMMGGLAVVGTNTGGTKELISHGFNGYLYEQGNIEELCDLLKYLIINANIRVEIGKNAYKYAKDNFLISKCAKEVEKVYLEVLKL